MTKRGSLVSRPAAHKSSAAKVYAVLVLFLALKAGGNSSMACAMLNPFVAMGIFALILALLTRMTLLSLADLSFVLPVTAIGYVISVFLGKVFLHETVTNQRWLGTVLIFAGALLVGTTSRNTTRLGAAPDARSGDSA
jgi:drug/metabolite transporter (DMT)-like permease